MTNTVDIFTTPRLVEKFCNGKCALSPVCNPKITDAKTNDRSGMNLRVVGQVITSECPIMARVWPFVGWVSAENHTGRCGYQE
ncbi:MAG: hypothetical protein Fur0011_3430 [Candidatus Microgenomates bacterium]